MLQELKGVVFEVIVKVIKWGCSYQGDSYMRLDGIGTYSMQFADGSRYVVETYCGATQVRTTGYFAEQFRKMFETWYYILFG